MKPQNKYTGFAIALAWPQTWCKQPNAWYDSLMLTMGFSINHYYRAGHAALVLVEKSTGDCHYFDFGRYHAPFGYGRVRSAITDHDLDLPIKAQITEDGKSIKNFREILEYLHQNQACHGNGDLFGSYTGINFQKAYDKALQMQSESPIIYGPFVYKGTNCSRFVQSVILAGKPQLTDAIRMKYFVPATPTPMSNVNAFPCKTQISHPQPWVKFYPVRKPGKTELSETLPRPLSNGSIPQQAKWLSGEGAGSWFNIEKGKDEHFLITRYSPEGAMECHSVFGNDSVIGFDPTLPYEVAYLSHCEQVRVVQNEQEITLKRLEP
jgi:hypothetical protein